MTKDQIFGYYTHFIADDEESLSLEEIADWNKKHIITVIGNLWNKN